MRGLSLNEALAIINGAFVEAAKQKCHPLSVIVLDAGGRVKAFQKQTGCTVKSTYAGSSDEMFAKFRGGGGTGYDLVSASGDASLRFIQSGAVAAVDLSRLKNWKNLAPQLQGPPHNTVNGKHYGISFMWGPDVLIYNTKVFKKAPTSWSVLYSKKYSGKISVPDNAIQIADVAVYLGYKHPYNLSSAQLARVKSVLQAQRPLIRKYWGSAGDFTNLFKSGEIVAGAAWPLMTVQLRAAHASVGETIPREGATGWADTWMLNVRARHPNCAYAWMNYATSPAVQKQVVAVIRGSPADGRLRPGDVVTAVDGRPVGLASDLVTATSGAGSFVAAALAVLQEGRRVVEGRDVVMSGGEASPPPTAAGAIVQPRRPVRTPPRSGASLTQRGGRAGCG